MNTKSIRSVLVALAVMLPTQAIAQTAPNAAESQQVASAIGGVLLSAQRSVTVGTALFGGDGTSNAPLSPELSADENARVVKEYVRQSFGRCVDAQRTGSVVTFNFNGCGGLITSGNVSLQVLVNENRDRVIFDVTSAKLTIDSFSLLGFQFDPSPFSANLRFGTADGKRFGVRGEFDGSNFDLSFALRVRENIHDRIVISGSATLMVDLTTMVGGQTQVVPFTVPVTFDRVVYSSNKCYPNRGTINVYSIPFTFTRESANTGVVSSPIGATVTLPPYGNCPVGS